MRLLYKNKVEELERLANDIRLFGQQHALDVRTLYNLNLCIDEVFTNIIYHAFDDDVEHTVEINIDFDHQCNAVVASITDTGKAFNPLTEAEEPDITTPLEQRKQGGLGIFFLKKLADKVEYRREGDKNILILRKLVARGQKSHS